MVQTYVRDKLLPIFRDLGSRDLLSKCTHGTTQNNNEALNGFVWTKCPKEIFVERYVSEVGVCSAVLNFNSGSAGIINVLKNVRVLAGHFTNIFCEKKDSVRVKKMDHKSTECEKKKRKKRRAKKKGFADSRVEKEVVTYEAVKF